MPTLTELLGENLSAENIAGKSLADLEDHFSTKDIAPKISLTEFDATEGAFEPEVDRSAALEFLGQSAWSFLDTASFGLAGLGVEKMFPDFAEDYLIPETKAGKVGAAIGGTVGFIKGMPMRLGAKAAQLASRPFIKKAGYETLQEVVKKSRTAVLAEAAKDGGTAFSTTVANTILKKNIGQRLSHLGHKARWDQAGKGVAKNWANSSNKAIKDITEGAIRNKDLTRLEADLIQKHFSKNLTTRPMQDIVDVIMKRNPNKFGFVAGSMIFEGAMFGMIDAAMEGVHAIREDRDYDPFAPLWGVGIGAGFGMLKLLPAAGKSSITGQDFMSGVRAVFAKNQYKTMSAENLIENAKIIGTMLKANSKAEGAEIIKYGGKSIDLLNPKYIGELNKKESTKLLRQALSKERVKYGRQMMGGALSEDFASSLANWKRILGGTAMMNARTFLEMSRGHEIPAEDMMTSLLIGAFINRKGRPMSPEMNLIKMQKIRRGLNVFGEPQYGKVFDMIPTLGPSQFDNVNPLTSREFKSLRQKAIDLKLSGKTPEEIETASDTKSPVLASSQKSFPLFDEFYLWLSGANGKMYTKPKALITEKEAESIESHIRTLEFEGQKVNNIQDFKNLMQHSSDKIYDGFEYELKKTLQIALNNSTKYIVGNPSDESLGTLPHRVKISQKLLDQVEKGQITLEGDVVPLTTETVEIVKRKINQLLETADRTTLGVFSENPKTTVAEVKEPEGLQKLIETINSGESRLNEFFGVDKAAIKFTFDDMAHLEFPLMMRKANKSIEAISKLHDDVENPHFNDYLQELIASGIVVKDPSDLTKFRLLNFNNITIKKTQDGYKGDKEESLVKTVIGILGAKGNKSLPIDSYTKKTITVEQVQKLEQFLNKNKVITSHGLLDMFRANITQKIFSDAIRTTNLENKDIAIIGQLADLGVPIAKYATLADGGTGFSLSNVKLVGFANKTLKQYEADINVEFNRLIEAGTTEKGKQIITPDRDLISLNKDDIMMIRSIMRRQNATEGQRAVDQLIDFVKVLDPSTTIRQSIVAYLERTNNPNALLNMMMGAGLIAPKKKKGVIEYVYNMKKFDDPISRDKINDFLSKYGVHASDIEARQDAADVLIQNYKDTKHRAESGALSQQGFFDKYFPAGTGWGSKYQEVEKQNDLIVKSLYRTDNKTGITLIRKTPHHNLVENMEFKVKDKNNKEIVISGTELVKQRKAYSQIYKQVIDDVQRMLIIKDGTISKSVLSVDRGEIIEKNLNIQKNNFTKFLEKNDIPFVFVDGEIFSHHWMNKDIKTMSINVFDLDSPVHTAGFQKDASKTSGSLKSDFYRLMKEYKISGADSTDPGVALVRMGNAKHVIAVPRGSYEKVRDIFKEKIYDRYLQKAKDTGNELAVERIESMMEELNKLKTWSDDIHVDAMRSIIVNEMTSGKNVSRFLELIDGGQGRLTDIGKRFSLYHTPSFKRLTVDLLKKRADIAEKKDAKILYDLIKRDPGFIVWNDETHGLIKDRDIVKKAFKRAKTKIEDMVGEGRMDDKTGYDSISFISENFKRVLELFYGVSGRGSTTFKPIISSNGQEHLMFGKTVFVFDPDMQAMIFSKSKNLDIMMTRSADKMKSAISSSEKIQLNNIDRPEYIDKTETEMIAMTTKELEGYIKTIPMENIGVSVIPESRMLAKQSYSLTNYMDSGESAEYFNSYYMQPLEKFIGTIGAETSPGQGQRLIQDSMFRRLALLKLKNINPGTTIQDMQNSPEGLKNLGYNLQWAALGGDPRALGTDALINTIKSKFLDPILSPSSIDAQGKEYGGKFVLKQSFQHRDLEPTIRTGEGKNAKIRHGEMLLPAYAGEEGIKFKDPNMEMKAVDNKGNVRNIAEVYTELAKANDPTMTKNELKELWEYTQDNYNLRMLHEDIKLWNPDWSIGIIPTRYPRTAPNDMAILRLKGFLGKEHGNTGIVNDFDVLNIFEGDYDVDEVDFFWGMNRGTWNHINRVKHHWVNTKNPDHYQPPSRDLQLLTKGANNEEWNTFDANNRVFQSGIGIVQKTIRLTNHVADLGVKNEKAGTSTEGMNDLMEYKAADGNTYKIAVDYDNASFFNRTSLESQLIIDYWKGVSPDIVNNMVGWRNDYLFPLKKNSIGKEKIQSLQNRQQDHTLKGPENSRIRLFRKFRQDGEEVDLSNLDKIALKTLMSQHSKLLSLTREVYDGSGQSNPATYADIMRIGRKYFNGHMNDITTQVFLAARRQDPTHIDFDYMFGKGEAGTPLKTRASAVKKSNKLFGELKKTFNEELDRDRLVAKGSGASTHHYKWFVKSPFTESAIAQGKQTQASGGTHGSVIERIYREIVHKDPLNTMDTEAKSESIPEGSLFNELEFASSMILSKEQTFGNNPAERMSSILPELTKNVNTDIKTIKYYNRLISDILNSKELTQKTKEKRKEALESIIEEKQAVLKDYVSTKYLETGDVKYLESIKTVDIQRESDYIEGTLQMFTLHEMTNKFTGGGEKFYSDLKESRSLGYKLYNEYYDMGDTSPYKNLTYMTGAARKTREKPMHNIQNVEDKIMADLEQKFLIHKMPFLYEYAMPTKDETTIGLFYGNPLPIATKPSARFKRVIRFLFDKHNTVKNKQEKEGYKAILESLAGRYTAFSNMFDKNFGLIPLKDQDVFNMMTNVPGFSKRLTGTFDRYESLKAEKGAFSQDMFGMGPEYDTNVSFYRKVIGEAFNARGGKGKINELEGILSHTNQLVMENGYMDPVSYFYMTQKIKNDLAKLGFDQSLTAGVEGMDANKLSAYNLSPEMIMLGGRQDGVAIKPMALLNEYRMNMLKQFIKQGKDIKKLQKRGDSETWEDAKKADLKSCTPKMGDYNVQ